MTGKKSLATRGGARILCERRWVGGSASPRDGMPNEAGAVYNSESKCGGDEVGGESWYPKLEASAGADLRGGRPGTMFNSGGSRYGEANRPWSGEGASLPNRRSIP